jgi:hypothetical protein
MLVRFRIVLLNIAALAGAVAALVPLALDRRPLGHGKRAPRRVAQIHSASPRRRAAPP